MANVGPTAWYVRDNAPTSTIGWSAVTTWAALTTKTAGQIVRQLATPTVGNERVFACIIAGTTLGAEPTWVVTKGAKTAEAAGPTWQEVTGQPGVNGDTTNSPTWLQNKNTTVTLGLIIYDSVSAALQIVTTAGTTGNGAAPTFSATAGTTTADNTVTWTSLGLASGFGIWAAPFARLQSATTNWLTSGNTVYVGDDHTETQSSAMSISTVANNSYYCVDHTVSLPPTSGNLKTTASIATTGASNLTISNGGMYLNGLIFSCGSSGSPNLIIQSTNNNFQTRCDNCAFIMGAGTTGGVIQIGPNVGGTAFKAELTNCTIQFANTSQTLRPGAGFITWRNTPSMIQGATFPTNLLSENAGVMTFEGCDLSAMTTGNYSGAFAGVNSLLTFLNCKLGGAGFVNPSLPTGEVNVIVSDTTGTIYQQQRYQWEGTLTQSTSLVRTSGASDGTTAISWSLTTTTNASWIFPFRSFPISIWNTVTATNRVVAIAGTYKGTVLPKNDEIWLEVEYLGSASSPLASLTTQTKANGLAAGSNLSADTASDWTGQAAAYQTANAYGSFTGFIKAGNASPQQVFFMASHAGTGTSGGSTTIFNGIADGAQVTDNAGANQIVWQAMMRFTLTVTLSAPQPQMVGVLRATVKAALASTTWWVDPLIALS